MPVLFIGLLVYFFGCQSDDRARPHRIAVILDVGGIEDRGKNAMIWRGCTAVLDEAPVEIELREPKNLSEGVEFLEEVAAEDYDLIITAASPLTRTAFELADKYPETGFLLIDAEKGRDNVKTVSFPHYESGYLMGVLAAEIAKKGKIGFAGGREDNVSEAVLDGFADGALSVNPDISVLSAFIGDDYGAAANTDKAVKITENLVSEGVEGIFVVAGYSTEWIIETAAEDDVWAIAYEANLNSLEYGNVVSSSIRHLESVISDAILATIDGNFEGGADYYPVDCVAIEYIINEEHKLMEGEDFKSLLEQTKSEFSVEE
ncbi:MAG: BMP family ABC transporter substrate-binding protein [bacterium]|nr:BMP family ABC transporter substrate-binding protein [bacterium]